MAKEFKNYDPGAIVLILGELTIGGFAKGKIVKVEYTQAAFKHEKGAQGDGVRTAVLDDSGKITFYLNGTATMNSKLSTIAKLDRRLGNGVRSAEVKDTKGETVWHSQNAWLEVTTPAEFADDHTPREWVIVCDDLDGFTGGALR